MLAPMAEETAMDALARWEDAGAGWRLAHLRGDGAAVVELLTCHGEVADRLVSDDRALLAYLRRRPSSEDDAT